MEILQRKVQSRAAAIVRLYCWRNSGCHVRKTSEIFLVAVQMGRSQALVLAIVPVLVRVKMVCADVLLPPREGGGGRAAARSLLELVLVLVLVLLLVVQAGVFSLAVSVFLAVGLPLVLHPPVLEPHLHLLLR